MFFVRLLFLALRRLKSPDDYYAFQKFQAQRVVFDFVSLLPENVYHLRVLDFGCGYGAYSVCLSEYFDKVIAVDQFSDILLNSNFLDNEKIEVVKANLLCFETNPVDVVFCASVIEHVPPESLMQFIDTIKRNLRIGGYLYLSFPPFLSPIGGHLTAPFHYLPDRLAFVLTKLIKGKKIESYERMFGGWGLYKTHIGPIQSLLRNSGFDIIETRSRFMPRLFNLVFANNNLFNWHCEIIAVSKQS